MVSVHVHSNLALYMYIDNLLFVAKPIVSSLE